MTKTEITDKSNSYKTNLIHYELKISKYNNSIDTFSKFKAYLENSLSKVKEHKKHSLIFSIICSAFAAMTVFLSWPIAIIIMGFAVGAFERLIFFTRAENKFEHCINYLSDLLEN